MFKVPLLFKDNKKELLLIFTAALFFRLLWLLIIFPEGIYFFDSSAYLELAENFSSYFQFGRIQEGYFYKEHFRTPGYPIYLSVFHFLKILPIGAVAFQLFISSISCCLVYIFCVNLGLNKKASAISAFFLILDIPSILFASAILSDTLFVFFILFSFLFLQNKTAFYPLLIISGLLLSFAILTRPIGVFLPLLYLIVLIFNQKKVIIKSLVFLSASYLLVFLWMFRNQDVFGKTFISTVGETNLLYYRAAEIYSQKQNISLKEAQKQMEEQLLIQTESLDSGDYRVLIREGMDVSRELSKEIIFSNPLLFFKNTLIHTVGLMIKPARSYIDFQLGKDIQKTSFITKLLLGFQFLHLSICWLAFVFGSFYYIRKKDYTILFPVLLIIVYLLIASAGPEGDTRFRLPVIPFVIIVAARFFEEKNLPGLVS